MEVASIITSNKDIITLFEKFILSYSKLRLLKKDSDTLYFSKYTDEKLEIYYHYLLNDVSEELTYNYQLVDVNVIRDHFKGCELFIVDISFRNDLFFVQMVDDFEMFLTNMGNRESIKHILVSHPHKGITKLSPNNKA